MAKKYPEQIVMENITFKKSANELYLELRPELSKIDVEKFLDEKAEVVQWEFKPENRRALTLRQFNKSSTHCKWIALAKGRKELVNDIAGQLEGDERVRVAGPIYVREDLKHPNGFTFDDRIIIRFNERTEKKEFQALFKKLGVEKVEGPRGELGKGMMLVRVLDTQKQTSYEIAQKLAEAKIIESARVNLIQLHSGFTVIPNDTYFTNQWNLRNTGQTLSDGNVGTPGCDINVEPAWDISKGSPLVVIAILDSGCDLDHQDLLPNYVQRDRMYDALTGGNNADDYYRHGTCVAGIASSLTNSLTAQGVAGVGWHCRIMPVAIRFSEAEIEASLRWALNNHADIISMSWYWDGPQADIDTALQDCFNAGIVMFAATGNYAGLYPDTISYPASNPNVIAVGATNENDGRCTNLDWTGANYLGSQYGPELSVVAPGVHTWSTDMRGLGFGNGYNDSSGGGDAAGDYYEDFGGTSGATPHVAGLAGLMLAYNPTLTPVQVRTIIENTADDQVGDPAEDTAGWDKYMGHGRINAHAALVEVQTNHPYSPADVYIRDSLSDSGVEPYIGGPLCHSPDIIIRKTQVANPQADFANMTVDPGSDNAEIGNDNYIYIRVHNKGTTDSDIHARLYFAPLNTTCAPDLWEYLGQIDFDNVPAGGSAVSEAVVWENVPDPGSVNHFCIIASIEGFRDPQPDPTGISNASQYMQFIRDHNNICYRNVVFEDVLPNTTFPLNFHVAGFIGGQDKYDLRIVREELAARAKIKIKLHEGMFKDTRVRLEDVVERIDRPVRGFRVFELKEAKRPAIKGLVVAPGGRKLAQLEIRIPDDAKPGERYCLSVQQVFEGEVIGEFHVIGKAADPEKAKFIAVRGAHLVHKADCKCLKKADKQRWIPFESIEAAKAAGYDMALDCLNQPFTAKEISYYLARRVLQFVNKVELADDLGDFVKTRLGKEYFEERYDKERAKKRGYSLGINIARNILEAREEVGRFTRLEELDTVKGIGADEFIDLINSFK